MGVRLSSLRYYKLKKHMNLKKLEFKVEIHHFNRGAKKTPSFSASFSEICNPNTPWVSEIRNCWLYYLFPIHNTFYHILLSFAYISIDFEMATSWQLGSSEAVRRFSP